MAKTAADYGVTFGYKAQDGYYYGPNGVVGPYHRGNDRPTPTGTPIVIGGKTIGLTGATGIASGPHLHTQACTAGSNYSNDLNPGPYEFKFGRVVVAGSHSQFGNRIVIQTGNVDLTYAHLSKINVRVGDTIGATFVIEIQPPVFQPSYYAKLNPDLARNGITTAAQLRAHWLKYGIKEGRNSAPNFHVKQYLANYADLRKAYGATGYAKALLHYYNNGINEDRKGRTVVSVPVASQITALKDKIVNFVKGA